MGGSSVSVDYGNWVSTRIVYGPLLLAIPFVVLAVWWHWLLVPAALLFVVAAYFAWARRQFSPAGGDVQRRIRDLVLDGLEWDGNGIALDIGCGSGALAVALAKRFPNARVIGTDSWGASWGYSRELCETNARLEGVGDRITFERASAESLPFEDDSFDAVVTNLTFHEVPTRDKVALIREALRVLRPGGVFAFQDLFLWKSAYGDTGRLLENIEALGVSGTALLETRDAEWIPRLLRLPFMVGTLALLKGVKGSVRSPDAQETGS